MKKTAFFLLAALIAALPASSYAQTAAGKPNNKPKAAVYIMGNPEGRDALRMAVNNFLVKSGKYQMVAVDAIDVVAQEHKRQLSGSVSDEQIAKLGQDAGAQYVCVVERTELDGTSYVATRMVSVQSKIAELADMAELPRGGKIIDFIQKQIGALLEGMPEDIGTGTFTDNRDGTVYKTVAIGGNKWMAENLKYQPQPGSSWCYDNDSYSCGKYGRLYDWKTAKAACPSGWHVPSRQEWNDLVRMADGPLTAGKKLKARTGWNTKGNSTDDYGFSALPAGIRNADGRFHGTGSCGFWWTGTEYGTTGTSGAYYRNICHAADVVDEDYNYKTNGFSVRCAEDVP